MKKFFYASLVAVAMGASAISAVDQKIVPVNIDEMRQLMAVAQEKMLDSIEGVSIDFYEKNLTLIEDLEKNYCLDEANNAVKLQAVWSDFMDKTFDTLMVGFFEVFEESIKRKLTDAERTQFTQIMKMSFEQMGAISFGRAMRIRSMAWQRVHGKK